MTVLNTIELLRFLWVSLSVKVSIAHHLLYPYETLGEREVVGGEKTLD